MILICSSTYGNMLVLVKLLGGEVMTNKLKPKCKLVGMDGNIFCLLGRVSQTLKSNGQPDKAKEVAERVISCGSYNEALEIIMEYVDVE